MKHLYSCLSFRLILILLLFGIPLSQLQAQQAFYTTVQSGNWNDKATWDIIFGTPGPDSIPGLDDAVFIQPSHDIQITENQEANAITFISNGASSSLTQAPGTVLTVNDDVRMNSPNDPPNGFTWNIGDAEANIGGNLELIGTSTQNGNILIDIDGGELTIEEDFIVENPNGNDITFDMEGGEAEVTLNGDFQSDQSINLLGGTESTFRYTSIVDQEVGGGPNVNYANLILEGSDKTLNGPVNVAGELAIGDDIVVNQRNFDIIGNTSSNFSLGANSELIVGDPSIADDTQFPTFPEGNIQLDSNSTVTYSGAGTQQVKALSYENLTIANTNGTAVIDSAASVTVNNNLTITADAGTITTEETSTFAGDANFTMDGGRLELATAGTLPSFTGVREIDGGTIALTREGDQTLTGGSYGSLEFAGSGIKNVTETLNIDGDLRIEEGVTLDPDENNLNLTGDWTNFGDFEETNTSVSFNGDQIQELTADTTEVFYNWTVNNSTPEEAVFLNNDVRVNNNFNLIDGIIVTQGNQIILSPEATDNFGMPDSNDAFVEGELVQSVASTGPQTLNFPVGGNGIMQPISLSFEQSTAEETQYMAAYNTSSAQDLPLTLPDSIDKVSSVGFWQIDNTGSSFTSAQVTIPYGPDQGVTEPEFLRIVKSSGGGEWENITDGTGEGQGSGAPSGVITSNIPFSGLSEFTLANAVGGENPLPVELLEFQAQLTTQNTVKIFWSTSMEKNSDYFALERSAEGEHFEVLKTIAAAGNSNTIKEYQAYDLQPQGEQMYYRLRQVDLDGHEEIFGPVRLKYRRSGSEKKMFIYPNPIQQEGFFISLSGLKQNQEIKISLYNLSGKAFPSRLLKLNASNATEFFYKLPADLKAGTYIINIQSQESTYQQKIVYTGR